MSRGRLWGSTGGVGGAQGVKALLRVYNPSVDLCQENVSSFLTSKLDTRASRRTGPMETPTGVPEGHHPDSRSPSGESPEGQPDFILKGIIIVDILRATNGTHSLPSEDIVYNHQQAYPRRVP